MEVYFTGLTRKEEAISCLQKAIAMLEKHGNLYSIEEYRDRYAKMKNGESIWPLGEN